MIAVLPLEIWHQILQFAVYAPHYLEDAQRNSPLVERNASNVMSTTITETKAALSRLALVNKSFRSLASKLEYQHLIFHDLSDLEALVYSINTNQGIHTGLRNNTRTMAVLCSLGVDKAEYEANLGRLTTILLLTPYLTVIELCEPNTSKWRPPQRRTVIEHWFAQVASLEPKVTAIKFGLDCTASTPCHIANWAFLPAIRAHYPYLRYLHCNIACNQAYPAFRPPFEPLVLPNLESLVTCIAEYRMSSEDKVEHLTEWFERWRLPMLKHIAINGSVH